MRRPSREDDGIVGHYGGIASGEEEIGYAARTLIGLAVYIHD
jgi:hypothetical protein